MERKHHRHIWHRVALIVPLLLALRWLAPGYIESVWNLPALTGVLIGGIPVGDLLFFFTFGAYSVSVYEHRSWRTSAKDVAHGLTKLSRI